MSALTVHAAAAKAASEARAAEDVLSIGEHPDVLEDAAALTAAAEAVGAEAYRLYTNPFGVAKTVDARWPSVGLAPGLILG